MKKRMTGTDRTERILAAAVKLAERKGFLQVTREGVAKEAKVSTGLVSTYFGSMDKLRDEIMRVAVRDEIMAIIAAGVLSKNRVAQRAPDDLRKRAVESLAAA